MKKLCIIAILALILASCQESLEDRCEREAKEYTAKQCPIRIDKTTRMDSLTFERETHTIHYYYTLMGNADSEVVLKVGDGFLYTAGFHDRFQLLAHRLVVHLTEH